jgi:hypothetical protein
MNHVFRQVEAKHRSHCPRTLRPSALIGVLGGSMESFKTSSGIVIIVTLRHVCIPSARQSLSELI